MQLYLDFSPKDPKSTKNSLDKLEQCVSDVKIWMRQNLLKFNDTKTEFIVLWIPSNARKYPTEQDSLKVGDFIIKGTTCVRDLGTVLDNTLSMETHIS